MKLNNFMSAFVLKSVLLSLSIITIAPLWADERTVVIGIVDCTKDMGGNIIAVKLYSVSAKREMYHIELNNMGKQFGDDMEGRLVEAIGKITQKDNSKWIEIISYKEVEEDMLELT